MTKSRVFKDELLQQAFDADGFVKFRLFTPEQVRRLHDFYTDTRARHETVIEHRKFHATNDTDNAALIAEADAFIKGVMFEELDKHFMGYRTIAANYLIKQPAEASELGPHQDLRFVDESSYYSFNVWVATEPTRPANGCLRFLKGSHILADTIRPLPTYPWKYAAVAHLIPARFTDVTTEVGECVVLNHACIHASYPNRTADVRVAAILAMIPEEAEIFHYFLPQGDPANPVEKYAMTLDDFIHLKAGKRPENAVRVDTFPYDFSPMDEQRFLAWADRNKQSNATHGYQSIRKRLSTFFGLTR